MNEFIDAFIAQWASFFQGLCDAWEKTTFERFGEAFAVLTIVMSIIAFLSIFLLTWAYIDFWLKKRRNNARRK